MRPVVSVHYELMSAGDSAQVVCMVKLFRDVLAEGVASTSGRDAPTAAVIGVGPEQVAHRSFLWHLLNSVELSNLVKGID